MSIGSDIRDKLDRIEEPGQARRAAPLSGGAVPYIRSTADAFVILLSSVTSGVGYQLAAGHDVPNLLPLCAVGLLASFIYILRMRGSGYYDFPDNASTRVEIGEILICWFTTGLLLAFFAFLLKTGVAYSRGAFVIFFFLTPVGLLAVRKATKVALAGAIARGTVGRRDVVLIGDFHELAALGKRDLLAFFGASQVNTFTLSLEEDPLVRTSADTAVMNAVANFVRRNNASEVLLALPWGDAGRLEFVRDQMKTLPVAVRLLPDMRVRTLTNYSSSAGQGVPALEIQRAPLTPSERFVKRIMDVVLSTLALIVFMPIMLLTAAAIKLDSPGPVIFRQSRKGFNGKHFTMFKFRTMTVQENGGGR